MGKWYDEDFDRSYEISLSLPSSDDDSDGHDHSQGNARKRKRVKTEHSQQLGGSSSGGLTAAEAARARWGNPVGAAPAATASKPPAPAPAPTPAPREAAPAAASASASASATRPTRHRRPQPPTDRMGRIVPYAGRWRRKILKALDNLIGKYESSPGSVYVALHSCLEGVKGGGPNSFDLLGVFGSFEDANVKAMEYVWKHHSDYMGEGLCMNLTPERRPHMDNGVMYWYIDSSHGTLTLEGVDHKWGDFKVWVEKREIETYTT